jgi:hypothetical protein
VDFSSEATYTLVATIESLGTVGAVIVGGIWVYLMFIKNRQHLPRAQIKLTAAHHLISDKKGYQPGGGYIQFFNSHSASNSMDYWYHTMSGEDWTFLKADGYVPDCHSNEKIAAGRRLIRTRV